MAKKPTLLIAGPMLTNACLELVLEQHDWRVVATTNQLAEVAELAWAKHPDLLLIDLAISDGDPSCLIKETVNRDSALHVVILADRLTESLESLCERVPRCQILSASLSPTELADGLRRCRDRREDDR